MILYWYSFKPKTHHLTVCEHGKPSSGWPKALSQKFNDRTTKIWRTNADQWLNARSALPFSIDIKSMWITGHAAPEYPSHAK
jgi:hypothetical protein